MTTQKVNLTVDRIENGYKENTAAIWVRFDGSNKEYMYLRKRNEDENGNYFAIISGCRITFSKDFELNSVKITREYDVAGKKKFSTAKQVGSTSSKIKSEIIENNITMPVEVTEVVEPTVYKIVEGEVHHEEYETIRTCLVCNIPVYLAGPAGSGKNHTVEQIAKELGWNFYFSNSVQQEFKLTGFIDAGGHYNETEFYKACTDENDCIFFLDEMDASIPEVLTLLNAAIANKYFVFPTGMVKLNHVHFVAAGNTVGSGADEMYTGRMVIDQATLDRFVTIEFDYSRNIELAISKGNVTLVDFIRALRKEANEKGIRCTFSYRCITQVTKLENAGMPLDKIMKIAVMKGLDKDTIKTFNLYGSTKYHKALKEIQA